MAKTPSPHSPGDAAALAAAAMAAALSVLLADGPFEWMNVVIGSSLLLLIWAFEADRERTPLQRFAFAATVSLCALLCLGFLMEIVCRYPHFEYLQMSASRLQEWRAHVAGIRVADLEKLLSAVPPTWLIVGWVVMTLLVWVRERRFQQ